MSSQLRKRFVHRFWHRWEEGADDQYNSLPIKGGFLAFDGFESSPERRFESCPSTPPLRRAGSSMEDSLGSDNDDIEECAVEKSIPPIQNVINVLTLQQKELTRDFSKSGMPWEGLQCRSYMAGMSGIIYALPALFSNNPFDQVMWVVQATLSILADYFHIHHDSMWHGVDRYFATFNVAATSYRAYEGLLSPVVYLAVFPIGCFVGANRAKNRMDLAAWHWCHFLWHLSGGLLSALVVHLLYSCPNTNPLFQGWCRP